MLNLLLFLDVFTHHILNPLSENPSSIVAPKVGGRSAAYIVVVIVIVFIPHLSFCSLD